MNKLLIINQTVVVSTASFKAVNAGTNTSRQSVSVRFSIY